MKRLILFFIATVLSLAFFAHGTRAQETSILHENGLWYLVKGCGDRIYLSKSKDPSCLEPSDPVVRNRHFIYNTECDMSVGALFGKGATVDSVMSPVLCRFSEEDFPGNGGWYIYFVLRKKGGADSHIAVMKSGSGLPEGPYVYPSNGIPIQSQPLLGQDGAFLAGPASEPSVVRASDGLCLCWKQGSSHMIARLDFPWKLAEAAICTSGAPRKEAPTHEPGSTLFRTNTPDPCLIYDKGYFYLTMTMTPPDNALLAIIKDKDLYSLNSEKHPTRDNIIYNPNKDRMVQEVFGKGAKIAAVWSPEIHYFSEEEFPGKSGWYIYFALRQVLRKNGKVTGTVMKTATLKSASGTLDGPWVHPITGEPNHAQPLLDKEGKVIKRSLGPSVLRVPSGKYRGIYLMWVLMKGHTEYPDSVFQQRILISHFSAPWHMEGDPGTVTTPTQEWEMRGSDFKRPRVVEGPTAFYGDNGGVFLTYSASPFFSDYGLGQLTLKREGADYANPLLEESWLKYEHNPVFCSVGHPEIAGAGHGFFVRDAAGGRFFCYHAYPILEDGSRSKKRNAYIEPYRIDYEDVSPTAPDGVIRMGLDGDGRPGPINSRIDFVTAKPVK